MEACTLIVLHTMWSASYNPNRTKYVRSHIPKRLFPDDKSKPSGDSDFVPVAPGSKILKAVRKR